MNTRTLGILSPLTLMTSLTLSTDEIFYVAKLIMFCAILDDAALLLNKGYCSHTVTACMV